MWILIELEIDDSSLFNSWELFIEEIISKILKKTFFESMTVSFLNLKLKESTDFLSTEIELLLENMIFTIERYKIYRKKYEFLDLFLALSDDFFD